MATEFACLVGIPTMYAASDHELLNEFRHGNIREDRAALGVAFAVSKITAFVAIEWLLSYRQSHRFTVFAI